MKAALLAALIGAFATPAYARHDGPSACFVDCKANMYCMTCHGRGTRGFAGYLPVPQIAGLPAEYIQIQLKAFAERARDRNLRFVRYARVHGMSPDLRAALADYISHLEPAAHPGGSESLIAEGERIFRGGAPDNDVPACAVCHGPNAEGDGIFPRLAGQWRPYLIRQLANWDALRQEQNAEIMSPIAGHLTKEQILAVTAYLSSLGPDRRPGS